MISLRILILGTLLMSSCTEPSRPMPVTESNFARAATDIVFANSVQTRDSLGQFRHSRKPASADNQPIIRMNQDTLYSMAVLDLTTSASITLPQGNGRYQSVQIVNQDHNTQAIFSSPGTYTVSRELSGTRYAAAILRTYVNALEPDDVKLANDLQDQVLLQQDSRGLAEFPNWDRNQWKTVRDKIQLTELQSLKESGASSSLDRKVSAPDGEIDPQRIAVSAAVGWGGLPNSESVYIGGIPQAGFESSPHEITMRDVPVDAFWSITVYNKDGFLEPNSQDSYSFNQHNSVPNEDGSTTINLGGCTGTEQNCIPAPEGWNYVLRLYQPHQSILDRVWQPPVAKPREIKD